MERLITLIALIYIFNDNISMIRVWVLMRLFKIWCQMRGDNHGRLWTFDLTSIKTLKNLTNIILSSALDC